jgi:hypothetical protein
MPVNQDTWWGETMTLSAETTDTNSVPVAGLQSVSISASGEHTSLFTADSVLREDVRRGQMEVSIEFEYAKWDATFVQSWMGAGQDNTTIEDSSEVPLFNITGTIENGQGDTLDVEVTDVYFEELDVFEASMGEFISKNQSGTGKNMTLTETENV